MEKKNLDNPQSLDETDARLPDESLDSVAGGYFPPPHDDRPDRSPVAPRFRPESLTIPDGQ